MPAGAGVPVSDDRENGREAVLPPPAPTASSQPWRLLWRLPLFGIHGIVGTALALVCFLPRIRNLQVGGMVLRDRAHRWWARGMLAIFGVRLRVRGKIPSGAFLLVANHISWLDIVLIHAACPVHLVAKDEIRTWPLIGRLAAVGGTVFIRRGTDQSRRRSGRRMAALLLRGRRVGIFPEGAIRAERGVERFHPRLFAAAIRARVPVLPVAIRYDRAGDVHDERVFAPGQHFPGNLFRLLIRPPCIGRVAIGPALEARGPRSELARRARELVVGMYGESDDGTR